MRPHVGTKHGKPIALHDLPLGTSRDVIGILLESPNYEGSGQLLFDILATAGLEADRWLTLVPFEPKQKNGRPRPPTLTEVNAHSSDLDMGDINFLVLAGNLPLWSRRPDLRTSRMHGRAFVANGCVQFPIYNPAAAMRNPIWAADMEADLRLFAKIVEAQDWSYDAPETCVWCGIVPDDPQVDSNGVLYCEGHWRRR